MHRSRDGALFCDDAEARRREWIQRQADRPLSKRPIDQKACDIGLFSDDANQIDLIDLARK